MLKIAVQNHTTLHTLHSTAITHNFFWLNINVRHPSMVYIDHVAVAYEYDINMTKHFLCS